MEKIVLFCEHSYQHHQRFSDLYLYPDPRVQIKSVLQLAIRASCLIVLAQEAFRQAQENFLMGWIDYGSPLI